MFTCRACGKPIVPSPGNFFLGPALRCPHCGALDPWLAERDERSVWFFCFVAVVPVLTSGLMLCARLLKGAWGGH